MKKLTLLLMMSLTTYVFAGPGGGHSHGHSHDAPKIKKEKTQEVAKHHVKRLVESKKIDESWLQAKYSSSEKKMFGKKEEWVVTFDNEKGKKGKKLYIFLKLSGEFVAANFTGK